MIKEILQQVYKDCEEKKITLFKKRARELGFDFSIIRFEEAARFTRIVCERRGAWLLYWVDNDTPDGQFVIAFRDVKIESNELANGSYSVNISLEYCEEEAKIEDPPIRVVPMKLDI